MEQIETFSKRFMVYRIGVIINNVQLQTYFGFCEGRMRLENDIAQREADHELAQEFIL